MTLQLYRRYECSPVIQILKKEKGDSYEEMEDHIELAV